jgi:hypothetical protein
MSSLVFSDQVTCSHPLFQKTIFRDQQISRQTTIHALQLTASPTASSSTTRIAWQTIGQVGNFSLRNRCTRRQRLHVSMLSSVPSCERETDRQREERVTQLQQAQLAELHGTDSAPFEPLISHLMSSSNELHSQG